MIVRGLGVCLSQGEAVHRPLGWVPLQKQGGYDLHTCCIVLLAEVAILAPHHHPLT